MDRRSLPRARPRGASPLRRTRTAIVPIALVAIVVLGGCGRVAEPSEVGSPSTSSTPTATEPPATAAPTATAPPRPDELEVRAVLDRFWPRYLAAYADPTAVDPMLAELLVGEANETILGRFRSLARQHQRTVAREPSAFTHHVMTITFPEPDQATVRECMVDDLQLIQDAQEWSGLPEGTKTLIDGEIATSEVTTSLSKVESAWKIERRHSTEKLQGVRDCGTFSP